MTAYKVVRPKGTVYVVVWYDENTGKYSFINLSKNHICKCRFDTIEEAIADLEKYKKLGKVIEYKEVEFLVMEE